MRDLSSSREPAAARDLTVRLRAKTPDSLPHGEELEGGSRSGCWESAGTALQSIPCVLRITRPLYLPRTSPTLLVVRITRASRTRRKRARNPPPVRVMVPVRGIPRNERGSKHEALL